MQHCQQQQINAIPFATAPINLVQTVSVLVHVLMELMWTILISFAKPALFNAILVLDLQTIVHPVLQLTSIIILALPNAHLITMELIVLVMFVLTLFRLAKVL